MPFSDTIVTGTLASQLPQYTSTPATLMVSGTMFPFVQDTFGSPALKLLSALQMAELYGNGWVPDTHIWAFVSADSPTYRVNVNANVTGTFGVGDKVKLTHSSQDKNFIITQTIVSGSATFFDLYGGTDYTLSAGAITNPSYSHEKSPYGFSLDPTKWTTSLTDTTQRTQSNPSGTMWYNAGSLSLAIPIGAWQVYLKCMPDVQRATLGVGNVFVTLSTSNNSESDADFTAGFGEGSTTEFAGNVFVSKPLILTSKTTYFVNIRTTQTGMSAIILLNSLSGLFIRCVCAYL